VKSGKDDRENSLRHLSSLSLRMKKGPRRNRKNERSLVREEGLDSPAQRDLIPQNLPSIQDQLCVGMRLRFISTASGNNNGAITVSYQNLLDSWLIAGSATAGYQLFDFVKIKRVTVRAMGVGYPYVSASTVVAPTVTVGIDFPGLVAGALGGGKQVSDTALGTTRPAFCTLKPDPRSQQAQYQPSSSVTAFVVRFVDGANAPNPVAGAVVDVDCVFRNSADVNPAAVASAISGAQPGAIYFGGLDGARLAATALRSAFVPRI
jgi:hypothetical protein